MPYVVPTHLPDDAKASKLRRVNDRRTDLVGETAVGSRALLALQRQAGNRALARALSSGSYRRPIVVQRCGRERHEGCSCANVPAEEVVQREAAEAAAPQTDVVGPSISVMERAAVQLRARIADAPSDELALHLINLETAKAELMRLRAEGTPEEQARIAQQIQAAAVEAAPSFIAGQLPQQAPDLSGLALQRFVPAAAAPVVAAGVAAGPPGWAILAGVAVVVAVVAVVYVATRDEPVPAPADAATEPKTEEKRRSCATEFPELRTCESLPSQFVHASPQVALSALKARLGDPQLRLVSPAPSESGPCPGVGMHYGVKSAGVYVASISCCPCCTDTPSVPLAQTRCRII